MITKNILWNLSGSVLPLLVGAIVFPILISTYGNERFGLLAIAWSLVGYFSLFDMGLSRALTQVVSEKLNSPTNSQNLSSLVNTAFITMWLLGILGGVCLWLITPWLIGNALSISGGIKSEAIRSFTILAISIPFIVHTSALKGVMDALHLFKQSSLIKMVLGVGTFLGPYFASTYSVSLEYAAYSLVLLRLVAWLMHWIVITKLPQFRTTPSHFQLALLKPLFAFGGWMSVSNVIGPVMIYLDRFVIASLLSAAAVSYYVAPYEVVTKLWVIPAAISGVLFPLFARKWQTEPQHAASILNKGMAYTLILLFPAAMLIAIIANEWLSVWLNQDFSVKSAAVVRWLAAGVLVNSIAQILYAKVQGAGKANWTAKLHLAESIPYLSLLWLLIKLFGIEGAAIAWFLRVLIDLFGLIFMVNKINYTNKQALRRLVTLTIAASWFILSTLYFTNLTAVIALAVVAALIYCKLTISQLKQDGFWPFKPVS